MVRLMGRVWGGGTTLLYHAGVLGSTPRGCTHHVMCECVVCVACRAVPPPEETACIAPSPDRLAESSAARQRLQTLIGPRVPMHCMRGYGATAARLTPDQKVGSSNLSGLLTMVRVSWRLGGLSCCSLGHMSCMWKSRRPAVSSKPFRLQSPLLLQI